VHDFQPKNALIKQYQNCFMDDVEFSITDEALDFIVGKGLEYKLGARGCVLCEAVLTECTLPSSDVKIRN
jgi:ATP-dependent Clp protease ATP-binding subunit ClpX